MKKNKSKQIYRWLLIAAVVFIGLTYFSTPAQKDYNDIGLSVTNPGNFDRGNFNKKYKLGDSARLYISIENYKEKNGFTPVLLSTGSLTIMKCMDRMGSVFDYIDTGNGNKKPLFRIDIDEGFILTGWEEIPCEITLRGKMRTRLRLDGKNAKATVAVSQDKKEGELFLFNGQIQVSKLCFIKETGSNEKEVEIFGPDIHGLGKFIFENETNTIYCAEEYKQLIEMEERARKRLSASPVNIGESIPLTERQALIALYNSTNGDSWENNSGWKTPPLEADGFAAYGSEGVWYGITVESGHVTQIILYRNSLTGTIPPELEKLNYLVALRLFENSLSGTIPPELENLNNLENLSLRRNSLSGSIPPELGNSANLRTLSLCWNSLSGTIPTELKNLIKLEYLNLERNNLSGGIPPELGNLITLQYLYLPGNSFSGNIPPELGNLINLRSIGLSENNFSGTIPIELGNVNNLQIIWLGNNSLSGNIPPELGNLCNLWSINVSMNNLSSSIPPELGNPISLFFLYLNGNSLSGIIPPELGNLTNLRALGLNSNKFLGEIPTSLTNLTEIISTNLNIRFNALYTNDTELNDFLKKKGSGWKKTQTIAPTDVVATLINPTSLRVSWEPIRYTDDSGGYEVHKGTTPGGPYTLYGTTVDKSVSSMQIDDLVPGTTYYFVVRTLTYPHSDNQNTVTSKFSSELNYITPPTVTTAAVTSIGATYATCGGEVTSDGGAAVTYRGVCWNTTGNPTTGDINTVDGSGIGSFTSYITGLTTSTTYYVCAYAKNSLGTSYGKIRKFKTLNNPSISGTVTGIGGNGVPDVTLYFSNNGGSTKTDPKGFYSRTVTYNWSGTVTPSKTGYAFNPAHRTYNTVTSDISNQDYTAFPIVLSLQASRETESAWIIRRQYGKIELSVENPENIPLAKYTIFRKEGSGIFLVLKEIPDSQLQDGTYLYYDKYLDKAKTYTYKFTAVDAAGLTIGVSNEKTI